MTKEQLKPTCYRCFQVSDKLHHHPHQELCDDCENALYPSDGTDRIDTDKKHLKCGKRLVLAVYDAVYDGNMLILYCPTCKKHISAKDEIADMTWSELCSYM